MKAPLERIRRADRPRGRRRRNPPVPRRLRSDGQRRNGLAVSEARDGMCTICHVRLRPQVFNNVRRNEAIIQCDTCQRILYFAGESSAPVPQA